MKKIVLASVVFLVLLSLVCAQEQSQSSAQDHEKEIDKIFNWVTPSSPGCAVAVSRDGQLVVNRIYGLADLERNVAITLESLFDAGSIRKQFVAAAILLLAEEGKLDLTDDVRTHIPELPDYGHTITINHLLTHTSGIRDWQPLLNLAGGDPDAMTMILRQRELNFVPGEEWSYSNSGYVLLPEIASRVSGVPFSEFARKRLFEPTGMKSSTWVDDPLTVVKNRALAYSKESGGWKLDMYLGNDRGGAGALFTTAVDLVAWNDALTLNRLGTFVTEKLREPAVLNNGRKLTYARGLQVEPFRRGGQLIWHSGGAAGYSAIAAHLPQQEISVAIMCNQDGGARPSLSGKIIDLYLPGSSDAPPSLAAAGVDPVDLSGKGGTFLSEKSGDILRLAVGNNALAIAGGGPLVALSANRFRNERPSLFFMSEAEFELEFLSADEIELRTKDGIVKRYRRAQADTTITHGLDDFSGRYNSDELIAFVDFSLHQGRLQARLNEKPGAHLEFRPISRDTFQFAGIIVRFTRDQDRKVTGFDFTNPVLRKVKFTRVTGPEDHAAGG